MQLHICALEVKYTFKNPYAIINLKKMIYFLIENKSFLSKFKKYFVLLQSV